MIDSFSNITLNHYLALSGLLFCIGAAGVLLRRNLIVIYMGLELMLNAANLALVAFSRFGAAPLEGHVMVFLIITVAAAEVAVGLALIVALFRLKKTVNTGDLNSLKF